jgi:hypothetical protein
MNPIIERRLAEVPRRYRKQYLMVVASSQRASRTLCIKLMCLQCVGFERKEIAHCSSMACPLYRRRPFQDGPNTPKKRGLSGNKASDGTERASGPSQ